MNHKPRITRDLAQKSSGAQVKGIAFRSVIRVLGNLRGEAAVSAALQSLSIQLAEGLRHNTITASAWYPIEWYRELFEVIVSSTGNGERIVREIGRGTAQLDMSGVYKGAFKLLSPEVVFALSTRLFSNYYNTGTVRILESRGGFVHASWDGCTGFDRNLWVEVLASCETYLEMAGAKSVRSHVHSGAGSNDEHMVVHAHWT